MKQSYRCITNNPMVRDGGFSSAEYCDTDVLGLFRLVSGEVAKGYRLLSHPLTGSIRPDVTPYKTILISAVPGGAGGESALLMERAVLYAEELYALREKPAYTLWDERTKRDFMEIDLSIIEQALAVAQWDK